MNPLSSLADYELFVYTLSQTYSDIQRSTLIVVRRGASIAILQGEIELRQGFRLIVREKISFAQGLGEIKGYGYEVWQGDELLYWYDSQPHPDNPELAQTNPHHKHVHPDIKHNRVIAPGLSFNQPNLTFLIEEIQHTLLLDPPTPSR